MIEKLVQIRVESTIKRNADKVFAAQGMSTQTAIKILLTQVANTGKSPFDNLFIND